MKRFSFSLQYLLDVHSAREQAAEHALQTAVKQMVEADRAMVATCEARGRLVKEMERLSGIVKRSELAAYARGMDAYDREHSARISELHQCEERVDRCRTRLRTEMTSRCTFENLSDREREEWAEAAQVAEQKLMDEMAIGRWHRQEKVR